MTIIIKLTNAGEDVRKDRFLFTLNENENWKLTTEFRLTISPETENRPTM